MSLKIRYFGDPILRQSGKRIEKFDDQLVQLSKDMLEVMRESEGIGLAAQQVGLADQFCVMDVPEHPDYPTRCILDGKALSPSLLMPMSFANPVITTLPCWVFRIMGAKLTLLQFLKGRLGFFF